MLAVAVAIGAGTLVGGHRIIRTLGRHLTDLTVAQGLAAEVSAAATMSLGLLGMGSPVSPSHALASRVVGGGAATGLRNVCWRVDGPHVLGGVTTPQSRPWVGRG